MYRSSKRWTVRSDRGEMNDGSEGEKEVKTVDRYDGNRHETVKGRKSENKLSVKIKKTKNTVE